jgi:hypothetical protein
MNDDLINTASQRQADREHEPLLILINAIFGVLVLVGLVVGAFAAGRQHVGSVLLWSLACLSAGMTMGLLFGLPRMRRKQASPTAAAVNNHGAEPEINNNLIDISDWLTKIIVGVGLVELNTLPDKIKMVTRPLAECLDPPCGVAIAVSVVIFFTFVGFLLSYLNTRTILSLLLIEFDNRLLRQVEAKAAEAMEEAKTAADIARLGTAELNPVSTPRAKKRVEADESKRTSAWQMKPGNVHDDPWKGVFGGLAEANHRRMRAKVTESASDSEWFRIHVWVESTDPEHHPLSGRVRFFLHDSFANDRPFVTVSDGRADLRVGAYGAFTVGAVADEGATKLELDLAEDPSAPKLFREQ